MTTSRPSAPTRSRRGVVPSAVALSLLVATSACATDMLDEDSEASVIGPIPIAQPRCARWTAGTTAPVWRTGIKRATVVIGPARGGNVVAYGMDTENNRVAWVYQIAAADKGEFLDTEAQHFRAAVGFDDGTTHIVIGTVHGPDPVPPQPGEPPTLMTVQNLLNVATDLDQTVAAGRASIDP